MSTDHEDLIRQSQKLGLPQVTAEVADPLIIRALSKVNDVLVMLNEQNAATHRRDEVIFGKLDKAAEAAMEAKQAAADAHTEAVYVRQQFVELNGRTSKTIERVATLEARAEMEDDIEAKKKIKTEAYKAGQLFLPKKAAYIIGGVVAFLASLAVAWPAITAIWNFLR